MRASSSERFIGLMSGTSLDGIDGVLAEFSGDRLQVLGHVARPLNAALRAQLLALNTPGDNELHRAALAGNGLARSYAEVVEQLLQECQADKSSVVAIGAHGQTVRHRPGEFDEVGYTIQLNQPALLAELTSMPVVADFRSRDVAAGGQGAPLVPAFHQGVFGQAGQTVAVLNIGGISNLSVLQADGAVRGFDCGPGNALMDHWCQLHLNQPCDLNGQWAASAAVEPGLLQSLMTEPFLAKSPPKSTGRDLFNPAWLKARLQEFPDVSPAQVQATLTAFTAQACAQDVLRHAADCRSLIVCGGGALNAELMRQLQLALPKVTVASSELHGLPPLQVEAAAFAWLARRAWHGETGSLQSVTGARGARVLGCIYPA